ncbi:LacI family DNA-binding transcriptional regulator [Mucilaginibacter kameinonensis]|uniref:LacI family DNA-binding transcriptional regulator n=1 Tax=Mucilaginibacter kameinonensis TaxID=452286 RepID=UPI000EF768C9|nr:LacI family DNA-binding transcriptional regulator [Mucilaginibacter kameinonensis]
MTSGNKSDKVNMKTLAAELKLSTATISKALRDSYDIGQETKQRVMEAARRLNYVPNVYASSLRRQSSNTIAIIIPEIADSFFSQAINGIESIIAPEKYHSLIYLTHDDSQREASMLGDLASGRVDGVIMSVASNTEDTSHIKTLQETGIPIVFFDRVCEDVNADKIITDDFNSAYIATNHLLQSGCKNISLITISGFPSILSAREQGYRKALADNGITIEETGIVTCSNKYNTENVGIIKEHLSTAMPDGIVATVEHLTTSTYLACDELKLKIPDDVKVICFTNQITAAILNPPLTTILQPAYDMGKQAAEILFGRLSGRIITAEQELVMPSQLIARASTASN